MACKNVCKMCEKLILSESVAFTDGSLVITIPAGSYQDGCKYCIVVAQRIPDETTIVAPVVIEISGGTEQYPLTKAGCQQVTACGIRSRTKYSAVISTNATGGVFRMLGKPYCTPDNRLTAINGTAPTPAPAPGSAVAVGRKGDK